jgi:uncharacterized protein (TIGR03118 family)
MPKEALMRRPVVLSVLAAVICLAVAVPSGAKPAKNAYVVHGLVSDQAGRADRTDPNLVNAWGLAALPTGPWWIADNGSDKATVVDATGAPFPPPPATPLVVDVKSAPTGQVANPGSSFVVSDGMASGAARFIFATEEGKILGWSPAVSLGNAVLAADRSGGGAIFKGLAIASTATGDRLFATDFHNNRVDVFDDQFHSVNAPGAFVDRKLPKRFAPFGIQAIGGRIFVTFAKQDAKREDDVHGRGLGFVDVFDTSGKLLRRVARRGQLDAPWGVALAPSSFGRFRGDLLVGNFGDGQINAYKQGPAGRFGHRGKLRGAKGKPIAIEGLWALQFGLGAATNGPADTLFFTAGPGDEKHGLFGTIRAR